MSRAPSASNEEITALRAIAVIVVVGFHVWPAVFPGGFVGVDVFFVVSGYVVTRAYLDALIEGRLSWSAFFWRRVRRLLPAALVVGLASSLAAWFLLEPSGLVLFAESSLAQAFCLQNVLFWMQGDYFHAPLERPLMHTWSLAVEEQFYFLFPVLAILLRRFGRRLAVVVALGVASFVAGVIVASISPKTAFFLLPTRSWELLLGVACGLAPVFFVSCRVQDVVKVLSLSTLGIAFFMFDGTSVFPGAQSLLATGGTAAFLMVTGPAVVGRFGLRHPAASWLGNRSYSLYLWHWPVVVFSSKFLGPPSAWVGLGIVVSSLVAAHLTYVHVEDPVRRYMRLSKARSLKALAFVGAFGVVILFASARVTNGFPGRYAEPAAGLFVAAVEQNHGRCGLAHALDLVGGPICLVSERFPDKAVLIVGDSHADAIDDAIALEGNRHRKSVFLADTSCDLWHLTGTVFRCGDAYRRQLLASLRAENIDTVIFVSSWQDFHDEEQARTALTEFRRAGVRIVVSGLLPGGELMDPASRARRYLQDSGYSPEILEIDRLASVAPRAHEFLDAIASSGEAVVVSPSQWLCPTGVCEFASGGEPNFYDRSHLSSVGAKRVMPAFDLLWE